MHVCTLTMETWNCLHTKSIYELIPDHTPSGKYTDLVDQLLLEELYTKKIGRSYTTESTFWVASGEKIKRSYDLHKEHYTETMKKLKSIQGVLQKPDLTQEKKKDLQSQLDDCYMNKFDLEKKIKEQEKFLAQVEFLDEEMNKFYVSMRVVLRRYSETRDVEYLRKGIDLLSSIRDQRINNVEEDVRRTILLDEIGDVAEFRRLFDLDQIPLYQLYRLYDIYGQYKKEGLHEKFLTEAALYYVNHLTEFGEYSNPRSTCQGEPSAITTGVSWRNDEGEVETQSKQNEIRDNEIEKRSQQETDFYEAKANRWV